MQKKERIKIFIKTIDKILNDFQSYPEQYNFIYPLISYLEKTIASNNSKPVSFFQKLKLLAILFLFKNEIKLNTNSKDLDLIFWPFQFHHLDYCLPIIEALKSKGRNIEIVLSRKDLAAQLSEKGIPYTFIEAKRQYKISYSGFKRVQTFFTILKSIPKNNIQREIKNSLWSGITILPNINKYELALDILSKNNKPVNHIIGYDLSVIGMALCQKAIEHNQRSIRIQSGAINLNLIKYSKVKNALVWDSLSKEFYKKSISKTEVDVLGPILNKAPEKDTVKNYFNAKREIFDSVFLVAFSGSGHQTSVEGHKQNITLLNSFIQRFPKSFFFIKLHAKDSSEYYALVKDQANTEIIEFQDPRFKHKISSILAHSDYVITTASTVLFEAFRFKTPVLNIDALEEVKYIINQYDGLIKPNATLESLCSEYQQVLDKKSMSIQKVNAYFDEFESLIKQKPFEKIVSRIDSICSN